ncbi:MGMT family protein [Sporichthya polymorpha]|uniref:MGMT family protein n=1 Tax=Sporichthya polymorpha TaxID=35751 RepID=UPI00036CEDE5|nr:MGMT family protein [Sporichthya polymorpha]
MTPTAPREHDARGGRLFTEDYVEAVLAAIESIPPGQVLPYGEVAELVGRGGPRSVGRVLSNSGGGVPWWRVPRADGSPPIGKEAAARRAWRAEGTPVLPNGKVDMRRARWDGRTVGGR